MRWSVECPYCGESNEIFIDPSGGQIQTYVEDCQVCCEPWQVVVRMGDVPEVKLRRANG